MAIGAAVIGSVSALVGLRAAYIFDTPSGPSIVCLALVLFIISNLIGFITARARA
jgi:zinc transport system permease protein